MNKEQILAEFEEFEEWYNLKSKAIGRLCKNHIYFIGESPTDNDMFKYIIKHRDKIESIYKELDNE